MKKEEQIIKLRKLKNLYNLKKIEISIHVTNFKNVWKKSNKRIFTELCFCILTPQNKAKICDNIIKELEKTGILFRGGEKEISSCLRGIRFSKNKARYIIEAREFFFDKNKKIKIKDKIDIRNIFTTREWLVKNIKGIGYKEASHFLRNIGLGGNLAILDRHILKNLKELGIIKKLPKTLTKKKYLEIENKFRKFAKKIKIPISHLDLLFWNKETGEILK